MALRVLLIILIAIAAGIRLSMPTDIKPDAIVNNQLTAAPTQPTALDINMTTDKVVYRRDENIRVTVKNISSGSIFVSSWMDGVQKKMVNGGWERLSLECSYPVCTINKAGPSELKPAKSIHFSSVLLVYPEGTNDRKHADPGVYRYLINYEVRRTENSANWKTLTAYSSEFTIKL